VLLPKSLKSEAESEGYTVADHSYNNKKKKSIMITQESGTLNLTHGKKKMCLRKKIESAPVQNTNHKKKEWGKMGFWEQHLATPNHFRRGIHGENSLEKNYVPAQGGKGKNDRPSVYRHP